ncbi:MAG TPA: hypothetical protein DF383_03070 [Deltaproteobacteria bacterium]|nr:hypothetical protein [Deltaproteobacteria bacterium]
MLRRGTLQVLTVILTSLISFQLAAKQAVLAWNETRIAKASVTSMPVGETQAPAAPSPVVEAPKKEGKTSGYDKGFFIQTPDGKFKLVFGGYAQFQLEYERANGENEVGFRVRRARLAFSGNLASKDLTYKFQIDLAKFKDELLLDAYMNYKFYEALEVRFGQFTIPWIRQHQISSSNQEFVDRSLASNEFLVFHDADSNGDGIPDKRIRNGRDVGLMVHGKAFEKKLEYQGGIFNGSGTNSLNINNQMVYAGRAVYNFLGQAGYEEGDYAYHEDPALYFGSGGNYFVSDLTSDKVAQFGAETGLKYKGLSLQGEFFYRHQNPGEETAGKKNDYGYYAQAGYFVIPKRLELAARASAVFLEGNQNDKAEYMAGINTFIYGQHLKFQTDYSYLPTNTKDGIQNAQRFRLRMQTKF